MDNTKNNIKSFSHNQNANENKYILEEWTIKKNIILKNIRGGIHKWISHDESEYKCMEKNGLTTRQLINISDVLITNFKLIINDEQWCKESASSIMYGIKGFIQSLIISDIWTQLYNYLDKHKLCEIIYNCIEWQINNSKSSPFLLDRFINTI